MSFFRFGLTPLLRFDGLLLYVGLVLVVVVLLTTFLLLFDDVGSSSSLEMTNALRFVCVVGADVVGCAVAVEGAGFLPLDMKKLRMS